MAPGTYNPQNFPLRGPKDALRAARYARGRRYAACTSTAAGQMHMPTHIMKAGADGRPLTRVILPPAENAPWTPGKRPAGLAWCDVWPGRVCAVWRVSRR